MGILERRLREKQQRIDQIVEAAKNIFQVKGFAESTMNDIADTSELSRRTVYIYFKHKEELLLSIAAKGLNSLADQIEACVSGDGNTMDRARALFRHYGLLVANDPGAYRFLMRYHEGVQVVGENHELAVSCRSAIKRNLDALVTLLIQGAEDGSFRRFPDPVAVGRTLFFLICNSIESSVVSVNILRSVIKVEPESMVDSLFDIFATYLAFPHKQPEIDGTGRVT